MGIDGLWEILEGAVKEESLLALALREGIGKANRREPYRLGVDASIWFRQCQSVFKFAHAQAGENPELRTLFYRLCHLFELPVNVVFVFDGPGRPSRKRGLVVKAAEHWITNSFKDLIEAFGFSWQMAPGEAEAELAFLNRTGMIDAVITDDSDVFVFGVETVIRNPSVKLNKDSVRVLSRNDIESQPTVKMTRGAIFLVALLSGGDYDQGLIGCGVKIAQGLSRYGLGESLLEIASMSTRPGAQRDTDLRIWREQLRHCLLDDPNGHLGRRYPKLAEQVHDTFPDVTIMGYYSHPLCSVKNDVGPTTMSLTTTQPCDTFDLSRLAQLCEQFFTWGTPSGIETKFRNLVWKGAIVRMFLVRRKGDVLCRVHQSMIDSVQIGRKIRMRTSYEEKKVGIPLKDLCKATLSKLRNLRRETAKFTVDNTSEQPKDVISVWLPTELLESTAGAVDSPISVPPVSTSNTRQTRSRKRHYDEAGIIDLTSGDCATGEVPSHASASTAATRRRKSAKEAVIKTKTEETVIDLT